MPLKRTVICRFTLSGTPEWVTETLKRAAILPDKKRVQGKYGLLESELISDETAEVVEAPEPVPEMTYTMTEVLRAMGMREELRMDITDALRVISMERYP